MQQQHAAVGLEPRTRPAADHAATAAAAVVRLCRGDATIIEPAVELSRISQACLRVNAKEGVKPWVADRASS